MDKEWTEEADGVRTPPFSEEPEQEAAVREGLASLCGEVSALRAEQAAGAERAGQLTDEVTRLNQKVLQTFRAIHAFLDERELLYAKLEAHQQNLYRQLIDPVLKEIADIQGEYELHYLSRELPAERVRDGMAALLSELAALLEENGARPVRTARGEPFSGLVHTMAQRTPTEDPALHKTVERSLSAGFRIGERVIRKEIVTIYSHGADEGGAEDRAAPQALEASNTDSP